MLPNVQWDKIALYATTKVSVTPTDRAVAPTDILEPRVRSNLAKADVSMEIASGQKMPVMMEVAINTSVFATTLGRACNATCRV